MKTLPKPESIELGTIVDFKHFKGCKVVSRCYVQPQWLYQLRTKSGIIIDYIPGRMLRVNDDKA